MFRYSEKERFNKPLTALMNNGYVWGLVSKEGYLIKPAFYRSQLQQMHKATKGSAMVKIINLLH